MKVLNYIKESYVEFRDHVTWPSWSTLQQDTIIVTVVTVLLSIFLFIVDKTFDELLSLLFSLLR